ncbi:MAG: hypothetical protein ACFB0A_13215 [Croceivirga sp.]
MKKTKTILIVLLAICTNMTFLSCSEDDSNGTSSSDTFIRFSIDGTDYALNDVVSATSLSLTLTGAKGDIDSNEFISLGIFMPLVPVEGTYDVTDFFTEGDHKFTFNSEALDVDFTFADSGTITISAIGEEYIEGTFSGVVTSNSDEAITISNGSFRGFIVE